VLKIKVAVVMGGISPEHEISLRSGHNVLTHLPRQRFMPCAVKIQRDGSWCLADSSADLETLIHLSGGVRPESAVQDLKAWGMDVVFLALHGPNGEDGSIQGFFQILGIPYTGCGIEASAISMNKNDCRLVAAAAGLRVPVGLTFSCHEWDEAGPALMKRIEAEVTLPAYVKSLHSGSSIGVYRVTSRDSLEAAIEKALALDDAVLVEREIKGREFTCGILGNTGSEVKVMEPVEIKPKNSEFFDTLSKYDPDEVDEVCPALITEAQKNEMTRAALALYERIRGRGFSRVDFILDEEGFWFLELNSIPGLTQESILIKEALAEKMTLGDLMERITMLALDDFQGKGKSETLAEEQGSRP
jgi:D-alanine--D-alanine ligase